MSKSVVYPAIIGVVQGERAVNWAQLTVEYQEVAFMLHELALGEKASDYRSIGPIYVRQALNMQKQGRKLVRENHKDERW